MSGFPPDTDLSAAADPDRRALRDRLGDEARFCGSAS